MLVENPRFSIYWTLSLPYTALLIPLPCILSLSFDMGKQEIKMWGKGGVQRVERLEFSRCTYNIFFRSNAYFKSLFNFVELVVTSDDGL